MRKQLVKPTIPPLDKQDETVSTENYENSVLAKMLQYLEDSYAQERNEREKKKTRPTLRLIE